MTNPLKFMTNSIPVFYHIPKSSGTYVYTCMLSSIKNNIESDAIGFHINDKQHILARVIASVNKSGESATQSHDFEKLSILGVFIEAAGFRRADEILNSIFKKTKKRYNLYKFITLREAFSRERSLYHYLTSDKSKYELTHGALKSSSFEQHIMSKQLQESWLIRSLLNLTHDIELTEEHFDQTCKILQSFKVYDSVKAEEAVKETLSKCFGIKNFNQDDYGFIKNENIYNKIEFDQLAPDLQKRFNDRKKWDRKLYDFLIKKQVG